MIYELHDNAVPQLSGVRIKRIAPKPGKPGEIAVGISARGSIITWSGGDVVVIGSHPESFMIAVMKGIAASVSGSEIEISVCATDAFCKAIERNYEGKIRPFERIWPDMMPLRISQMLMNRSKKSVLFVPHSKDVSAASAKALLDLRSLRVGNWPATVLCVSSGDYADVEAAERLIAGCVTVIVQHGENYAVVDKNGGVVEIFRL